MSKRDEIYTPLYSSDELSDIPTEDDLANTPTTGLSQSFSFLPMTPEQPVSTPTVPKSTQKRKFGLRGHKMRKCREAKRSLLITPTKTKKICTTATLSLESLDTSLFPANTTADSPTMTVAAGKLGLTFELREKEPKIEVTVRSDELREKTVKVQEVCSNIVIDSGVIQSVLDKCAICSVCKKHRLKFWDKGIRSSIANYLTLRCEFCGRGQDFWTISGKFQDKIVIGGKPITHRNDAIYQSILGGRLIGVSMTPLILYHSMLGIPPAPKNIVDPQRELLYVAEFTAIQSMNNAVTELKKLFGTDSNNNVHDIASFDGAYQKRSGRGGGGFSRYCFGSVISMSTGKVLAYDVACNSCKICTMYENQRLDALIDDDEYILNVTTHRPTCPATYAAYSSVSLESEIAIGILQTALARGVIFDGLVCDGDNKTFGKISQHRPYEEQYPEHEVKRYECISHAEKRMKTHLNQEQQMELKNKRDAKKRDKIVVEETVDPEQRKTHLRDIERTYRGTLVTKNIPRGEWKDSLSVTLFASPAKKSRGKSPKSVGPRELKHITLELCSRITMMFHLAVKQNLGDTDAILKSVLAIPSHLGANERNAAVNHAGCPLGENSWCRYQKALAMDELPPLHPNYLSEEAVQLLRHTFDKYNYDKRFFIEQIADANTSNHNEAIHHLLFTMARKTGAIGMDAMKLASALAVIRYNEGMRGVLSILQHLRVTLHPNFINLCNMMDMRRVSNSYGFRDMQRKRFRSRMSRQNKQTASINLFGRDYESSKYSASYKPEPSPSDSISEVHSFHDLPASSHDLPASTHLSSSLVDFPTFSHLSSSLVDPTSPMGVASSRSRKCQICHKGEFEDTIIDDINICVPSEILNWIECPSCNLSYHFFCVGLDEAADIPDYEWNCHKCANKFEQSTFDL